jgi:hypothetical protein
MRRRDSGTDTSTDQIAVYILASGIFPDFEAAKG